MEERVKQLIAENEQLQSRIQSTRKKLKDIEEKQRLENQNWKLKTQVEYLEMNLKHEKEISSQLIDSVGIMLEFLDNNLTEQAKPIMEKARELLSITEEQKFEQEKFHAWGNFEL